MDRDELKHGEILAELAKIVDSGKLKPLYGPQEFELFAAREAHEFLKSGKVKRKVVLGS